MSISTAPFFDPNMSLLHRQLAHSTQTGTADLQLQGQRIQEDANLFRPFLERRFKKQSSRAAAGVADRGFAGSRSGIMRSTLGELGEDQAYAAGEFERGTARGLEDVERAIANLTSRNTMLGAEGVRQGAGNAATRHYPQFINF